LERLKLVILIREIIMSFSFLPAGLPISGTFSVRSGFAASVLVDGLPRSASVAEYVQNFIGPTGSAFRTVSASIIL